VETSDRPYFNSIGRNCFPYLVYNLSPNKNLHYVPSKNGNFQQISQRR